MCQVTNNKEWKKNRNLHAILLLDMILNNKMEAPYTKFPPEGPVPIISKSIVKSKLSNKFSEINEIDIKSNFDRFRSNVSNQESNRHLMIR